MKNLSTKIKLLLLGAAAIIIVLLIIAIVQLVWISVRNNKIAELEQELEDLSDQIAGTNPAAITYNDDNIIINITK